MPLQTITNLLFFCSQVTKYLVYNARKRGGDNAADYFRRTELIVSLFLLCTVSSISTSQAHRTDAIGIVLEQAGVKGTKSSSELLLLDFRVARSHLALA